MFYLVVYGNSGGVAVQKALQILALTSRKGGRGGGGGGGADPAKFLGGFDIVHRGQPKVT